MITANQITIAVTVYDRRTYIEQAITSALGQSCPVRVIVVEDCSPDPGLQPFLLSKFGSRVTYYRNAQRRGLFDNWNACLEWCPTPWLCLLHDDDFLEPVFVEAMLELSAKLPEQGLYYGRCRVVDPAGKVHSEAPVSQGLECGYLEPSRLLLANPVTFPGDLFRVEYARALGGFRRTSFFTADWDMWLKLTMRHGAAGTNRLVGNIREHAGPSRGTTRVVRNGKVRAFHIAQAKQNYARLRGQGTASGFDRAAFLAQWPTTVSDLLQNAAGYTPRMLAYNLGLLLQSPSPSFRTFAFRAMARWLGPGFVRAASRWYNRHGSN